MSKSIYELFYNDMHVLTCVNSLNGIIEELKNHNVKISCVDDLFNNNIMGLYKVSVNQVFKSDVI